MLFSSMKIPYSVATNMYTFYNYQNKNNNNPSIVHNIV